MPASASRSPNRTEVYWDPRSVWMVAECRGDHATEWETMRSVAGKLGIGSGLFSDPMWNQETPVQRTFSYNLNTFYNNFVNGRGIVW